MNSLQYAYPHHLREEGDDFFTLRQGRKNNANVFKGKNGWWVVSDTAYKLFTKMEFIQNRIENMNEKLCELANKEARHE